MPEFGNAAVCTGELDHGTALVLMRRDYEFFCRDHPELPPWSDEFLFVGPRDVLGTGFRYAWRVSV